MPHLLSSLFAALLFAALLLPCGVSGQTSADAAALSRLRTFVGNIQAFQRLFPQEKVYVQTDNTGYFRGETLWYKAYVVRTDSGHYTDLSRVLYVELVDPFGEVVETQKVPLVDGRGSGAFHLKAVMSSGFFELRAYTRYATNFDATGHFSRVLPIFERPATEGDYSQRVLRYDMTALRRGSTAADSSAVTADKRGGEAPVVRFFPEGGRLVGGLSSRVAFDVTLPDSVGLSLTGDLCAADGTPLTSVATNAEGRGLFDVRPDGDAGQLLLTYRGRRYAYPLPAVDADGAVMHVDAVSDSAEVRVTVAAAGAVDGRLMGLSVMHNGRVTYFDTLTVTPTPLCLPLSRALFAGGIHQVTLFGADGRIYAERQFFAFPEKGRDYLVAAVAPEDSVTDARGRVTLRLVSAPHTELALSVTDAAAATNAADVDAATWWLLSSELKGYVRHPHYYLESNDAAHRRAADLLCLVQGWTRYDWRTMSGNRPFEKRQPLEDSLYIDGRIHPRLDFKGSAWMSGKARRRTRDVADVDLSLTLYNEAGEVVRGRTMTDSAGYYAFVLPDLTGRWTAFLHARKEGEDKPQVIAINRLFAPTPRPYDYYETSLDAPPLTTPYVLNRRATAAAAAPRGHYELGEAVVKGRRGLWSVRREHIKAHSQVRYDMQREADSYADRGEDVPLFKNWFLSKPTLADALLTEKRAVGFLLRDSARASFWIKDNPEVQYSTSNIEAELDKSPYYDVRLHVIYGEDVSGSMMNDSSERALRDTTSPALSRTDAYRQGGPPAYYIDEMDELFVSMDDYGTRYMYPYEQSYLLRRRPLYIFYSLSYPPLQRMPSTRRTTFRAFQTAQTFSEATAALLPSEWEHRRTLLWEPAVVTDGRGEATVTLTASAAARMLTITAGGITDGGLPVTTATP